MQKTGCPLPYSILENCNEPDYSLMTHGFKEGEAQNFFTMGDNFFPPRTGIKKGFH